MKSQTKQKLFDTILPRLKASRAIFVALAAASAVKSRFAEQNDIIKTQ